MGRAAISYISCLISAVITWCEDQPRDSAIAHADAVITSDAQRSTIGKTQCRNKEGLVVAVMW